MIEFTLQGSPATGWVSSKPGHPGVNPLAGTRPTSPVLRRGAATVREGRDDGLPNPQAFALPTISTYPARTASCRTCEHLVVESCSRACCERLGRSHASLVNAIMAGTCPVGRFRAEEF